MDSNNDFVWIPNHEINKKAQLSMRNFLNKIECVKTLRGQLYREFTFYPTSKNDCDINYKIWKYVNKDRNALNDSGFYAFNTQFPLWLYYFLKHSNRNNVMKPSIFSIATLYAFDPDKRNLLENEVHTPIFEKALKFAHEHFDELMYEEEYEIEYDGEIMHETGRRFLQKRKDLINKAFGEYIGNSIIYPYISPFCKSEFGRDYFDFNFKHSIKLPIAYLSNSDWNRIIINGKKDDMERAESDAIPLKKWKDDNMQFHKELKLNSLV